MSDTEPAGSSRLEVINETDQPQTVSVGCRTDENTQFTDRATCLPENSENWSPLPNEEFEVAIEVTDGPREGEVFAGTVDTITATVTESGITFATEESTPGGDIWDDNPDGAVGSTTNQSSSAGNSAQESPAADEIYCRSCGEVIKQHAEICPECGVRNAAYQPAAGGTSTQSRGGTAATGTTSNTTAAQQQDTSESEPSGRWVTGVKLGAFLWFLVAAILAITLFAFRGGFGPAQTIGRLGIATLLPPTQVLAWGVLAVSMYFDLQYIDYHTVEWPLSGRLYLAAVIILPIITQVIGAAALFITGGTRIIGLIIPIILLVLSIRHLRTRSSVLSQT